MLHNASRGTIYPLSNKSKKKLSHRLRFIMSPGKSKAEPCSEASTPRRSGNAFSTRNHTNGRSIKSGKAMIENNKK